MVWGAAQLPTDVFVEPWTNVASTPALIMLPGGKGPDDAVTIPHRVTVGNDGRERAILDTKEMVRTILTSATNKFRDEADLYEEMEAMATVEESKAATPEAEDEAEAEAEAAAPEAKAEAEAEAEIAAPEAETAAPEAETAVP